MNSTEHINELNKHNTHIYKSLQNMLITEN